MVSFIALWGITIINVFVTRVFNVDFDPTSRLFILRFKSFNGDFTTMLNSKVAREHCFRRWSLFGFEPITGQQNQISAC
jgi:hypothetical protein